MTETIILTMIICGTVFSIAAMIIGAITLGSGSGQNPSTIDRWIEARGEMQKAKAFHEKVCPRTTDTPRKEIRA